MNKTIIPIKGMHCRSCEILISEKLKELPEINNAQVSYKNSQAIVYSKFDLNMKSVSAAIAEAGYEVGVDDTKSWISHDPKEYTDLVISIFILLILYFIARKLGIFNISIGSGNKPSNLLIVSLVGLTAGLSTCMALVGGLILGISARHAEKHPEASPFQKFRPHLYFNLGRITSFFILGGIVGQIGKAFQLSGVTLGIMTIIVGAVMLLLGAQLTELFPRLSNGGLTLPVGISKFFGIKKHHDKEYSHSNSMLVGALTFFLPCGFTQAMQLYAISTGNFLSGALIMAVFALGTAPGLLGVGGLTSILRGSFAKKFFKFTGLLVIALAIFNISNGYRLTGWRLYSPPSDSSSSSKEDPNVKLINGIQEVRMTQTSYGYLPNKFTIKNNIPVRWIVDSKDSGSCASSIVMPSQKIRESLSIGENIIEFTPTSIGELRFSCSMGMYSGKFVVIEGASNTVPEGKKDDKPQSSAKPATPSSDKPGSYSSDVQVIKTTFASPQQDISPRDFTVIVGKPVRFEVLALEDGRGCMGSIAIPGLVNKPEFFQKGKTITFEFIPTEKGSYEITCAMGVPRGTIVVT